MKNIFMAITILLLAYNANACSICGCGGGNLYLGMYPKFDSKFIGVRYNFSDYKTVLKNDPSQYSSNTYQSYELWSGFNLSKKWQIFTFIPYQYNKQVSDDGTADNKGIGDISILTNYQLINKHHIVNDKKMLSHQLWIGGGVKLNTGNFSVNPRELDVTLADVNAQLGSGSTDFIINTRDLYQVENWGIASNLNYKINTQNKFGYQFGNKLTLNTITFYNFNNKNTDITPNFGLQIENNEGNKLEGHLINLTEGIDNGTYRTGGHSVNLLGGIEVGVKKISFGVNIQAPIRQEYAAAQTNLNWKAIAHLTFSF